MGSFSPTLGSVIVGLDSPTAPLVFVRIDIPKVS